jgi:hypothetical protein
LAYGIIYYPFILMKKKTFLLAFAMLLAFTLTAQTTIFPFGSTWKYLDTGTDQGTAWRATAFDDGTWKPGNGIFGYGNRNEATSISYGPDSANKYITTYFRKAITIANPLAFSSFTGSVKRDDGVVVYVNGNEIYRNNLTIGTIDYLTRASSAPDNGNTALPFTIPASAFVSGSNVIAVEVHQTNSFSFDMAFDLELTGVASLVSGDQAPPVVLGINRQMPITETTSSTSVIFRATFSEPVTGVDKSDFQLVNPVGCTIASVVAVGTDGSTYDVTINGISGSGKLGLNLKSSATGIMDAASKPLNGGFTGQTYTVIQDATAYGFTSVTGLNSIHSRDHASKRKQQAKVFNNAGRHWAVLASTGGTYLWRLDGTNWTNILRLSNKNSQADCIVDGDVTHIFLFMGQSSELVSVEYDPATVSYKPWASRNTKVDLVLDEGIETGTIALDGTGRMWLTSDAVTDINVRYADAPYNSWSAPITIAAGVHSDDVGTVIAMPSTGKIGVFWSNQVTKRFGFRTHADGTDPATWTADEVPASQSALDEGKGMADDHMNMKIARDGTIYCAVKTSYDEAGFPEIVLLVRRLTGTWDKLYSVSENGTAPIVLLNEAQGKVKVVYTSDTYGGDILYKETPVSSISFGAALTLIGGVNNYPTSSHQNYTSEVVILASDEEQTVGVLARDGLAADPGMIGTPPPSAMNPAFQAEAFPNPFKSKAMIRFTLQTDGPYTLTLLNRIGQIVAQQQGTAKAGKQNVIEVAGVGLSNGFYFARLQSREKTKVFRLLLAR